MRYAVFLILPLFLLACQDLKKDGQIKEIEQLQQKRDSISKVFSEKAPDSTAYVLFRVKEVELQIGALYEMDTLDRELGEKLSEFKMIRKRLPQVDELEKELVRRLRKEEVSLHNLKTDIDKAAGDKSKYDENIALEREKITEMETITKQILATREQCLDSYQRLHQEMEAFSKSLEKKKE